MSNLKMFSFPVELNKETKKLNMLEEGIDYTDYSRKFSDKMFGLLEHESYKKEDEPYYDFYKSIGYSADRELFEKKDLRYDSTVIFSGDADGEFKKTAGHFHCKVEGRDISYPEYYQVVKGKALFVMQKVQDENPTDDMVVEDAILVEVNAGEAVVIPPDYGHCTVNISDETMVFINLVSVYSTNNYDQIKRLQGMCCYIDKSDDGYKVTKNSKYKFNCDIKIVKTQNNDELGIYKDVPVYTQYLENPDKFKYLSDPTLTKEYMKVLVHKETI